MSGRSPALESSERVRLDLIGVDLDGTLLNSDSKISPGNARALEEAHETGTHIAVVTGRRYSVARKLTREIACPHYLITNAGAWIASSRGQVLHSTPLDGALLPPFLEHLGALVGHVFLITSAEGGGEILFCDEPNLLDSHVAHYVERNTKWLLRTKALDVPAGPTVLQIVSVGTIRRMKTLYRRATTFAQLDKLTVTETVYPDRDIELIDVVNRNAGKGNGLAWLAQTLKVSQDRIMAIGDNYADTSMLEVAAYPVVMGNAPTEMRRQWPVTGSNDEDGVAQAIEKLLF